MPSHLSISMTLALIIAALVVFVVFGRAEEDIELEPPCSSIKPDEILAHLSTKTPYRVVANLDETPLRYPGCQPTRIWAVIRHGTRNPSKEVIKFAQQDLVRLKEHILNTPNTRLCPEELLRLRYWQFNRTADEEKFLVAEGEDELIELAERMQKRFPQLLPDSYDPQIYYFKYTKTQRTLKSAQSFASGLFGRQHIGQINYPQALHKDPILRVSGQFLHYLSTHYPRDGETHPHLYKSDIPLLSVEYLIVFKKKNGVGKK